VGNTVALSPQCKHRRSPFALAPSLPKPFGSGPGSGEGLSPYFRRVRQALLVWPKQRQSPSRLAQAAPKPFSFGPSSAKALLVWPKQRQSPSRLAQAASGPFYLATDVEVLPTFAQAMPSRFWLGMSNATAPSPCFSGIFSVFLANVRAFEAGFALTLGIELPGSLSPWPKDHPCGPASTESGAAETKASVRRPGWPRAGPRLLRLP
jgi:hypothetical protein